MSGKRQPLVFAKRAEEASVLPPGAGERFSGYGVMGAPFASGHYLALRHFTASSIGPGYRAVWHRDPDGRWTVHADAPPEVSCARFLGSALNATHSTPIGIEWTGPQSVTVEIPDLLRWRLEMSGDLATRLMSAAGSLLPAGACGTIWLLRAMGCGRRTAAVGRQGPTRGDRAQWSDLRSHPPTSVANRDVIGPVARRGPRSTRAVAGAG